MDLDFAQVRLNYPQQEGCWVQKINITALDNTNIIMALIGSSEWRNYTVHVHASSCFQLFLFLVVFVAT